MSGKNKEPVTEACHPFTENIDIFSPQDIVTQIHTCEQELFSGWHKSQGIFNPDILNTISELSVITSELIQNPEESLIVLSGCGTSGRLGFLTARNFNELIGRGKESGSNIFEYLIAGGDFAFFTSQERAEDRPYFGVEDLKEAARGKRKVLLIGISCGFSAPYVAGQLDYALKHPDVFIPVLLGFNEVEMARNLPIEDWNETFLKVAQKLEKASKEKKGYILNPLIGPEPITGSSRMKSGSATKIMLDTIFFSAFHRTQGSLVDIRSMFHAYQLVQEKTYSYQEDLGRIIQKCGEVLNNEGHVYYISDEMLGMFGLLDASECPPTYGADFEDIRGFINGGFSELHNKEGDLSKKVPISVAYFLRERLNELTQNDVVIFLASDGNPPPLDNILDSKAYTVFINITTTGQICNEAVISCGHVVNIHLPWTQISSNLDPKILDDLRRPLVEISCKWILNVISTGAHIQKGKVYQNFMIDLKVSNTKLYHRAVGLVQKLASLSKEDAEHALLKAIYNTDILSEIIKSAPIGDHIQQATNSSKVVPLALILGVTRGTVVMAQAALEDNPITRIALSVCLDSNESL